MLESERKVLGVSGLREIGWNDENTGSINRCELIVLNVKAQFVSKPIRVFR